MDSSPTRSKKKKSKSSAEDALEAKMAAKKKKERKSSKADDALEAKIRAKNADAGSGRGPSLHEEEKVVEGYEDEELGGGRRSTSGSGRKSKSKKSRGSASSGAATGGDEDELFTRGGGDVRNKPKPSLENRQQELDPLRAAQLEKEKNKKKVNPRYQELHETGQWGGLNKWEKYGICALVLGVVAAAIALGIKFGVPGDGGTSKPTQFPTKSPTQSPSTSPTFAPTDTEYRASTALEMMRDASPNLSLPTTPEELVGSSINPNATPQQIAAEFVIYNDPMELPTRDPRFMERYALAVFYYQNGGCSNDWIKKDNWMTFILDENNDGKGDHCSQANPWYGIVCDLKNRVIEVNLSKNYATGKIPMEFGQLQELSTLDLSNNALTGEIPTEAITQSKLYTIQLNNNVLEGEFPFEEVKASATILDNLWIQENTGLRGTLTEEYCAMNSITLDCDNFQPQPTYPDDSGDTSFEKNCMAEGLGRPKEFTCNSEAPVPFTKPPTLDMGFSIADVCGVDIYGG